MLARTVPVLPEGPHLVYEPKWDGFRALASTGPTRLMSRRGRRLDTRWPEVAAALEAQLPDGVLADGEIVRWADGRLDFAALQRRNRASPRSARRLAAEEPCHIVLFDLLREDGADLAHRALGHRRSRLERLFEGVDDPHLVLGWQTGDPATAREWFDGLADSGIEGLVIKDDRRSYRPGRRGWDKVKRVTTTEAVVGGVVGRPDHPWALILGRRDPETGALRPVGRTSDLDEAQREGLDGLLAKAGDDHPWPRTLGPAWGRESRQRYTRVEPELVVEIEPDVSVSGGKWRHLVRYVRPRPDLAPGDVPRGLEIESDRGG
ncbi:ATP-dependent DNA ligase [Nocardiopsis suaedae]|uniref:ATP-dependent DNA ligase n=1 Tax=Nocardiopsis suaedae TaxID=3018444 RepID=A0ABT4TIL5_9ACTN|nr:ATP-dependent DNA ligase [Nocardiopsis suaedae]MDA2803952.1 ATP-dependent DNA ligase [Nocardiopsis suaedae]